MKRFYLLTGSVMSFFFIGIGTLLLSGKLDFNLSNTARIAYGTIIVIYGVFRVFMFYFRIRNSGRDENN